VFAAVAVAGSTYAWFTLNQTATVDTLNVNVTAGEGLYVSLTGEEGSFSSLIKPSELLTPNFEFIPVTTVDGVDFLNRKEESITSDANGAGGYVSFDVWLRSKAALDIKLSSALVSSGAPKTLTLTVPADDQSGAWAATEAGINYEADLTTLILETTAANATRFSILGGDSDMIFDLTDDDGFGERIEPTNIDTLPVAVDDWTWAPSSYNRAFEYLKRLSPEDLVGAKISEVTANVETGIPATKIDTLEEVGGITFGTQTWTDADWYATKLTVKIWLEGWDADCFDVLFNDTVTINMAFTGAVAP
ncbi:MAG: hypothetical protein GX670_06405, partial [Bacteroidales bacterium]|nr:hypothetical protein [Bacteroidales bacterium]